MPRRKRTQLPATALLLLSATSAPWTSAPRWRCASSRHVDAWSLRRSPAGGSSACSCEIPLKWCFQSGASKVVLPKLSGKARPALCLRHAATCASCAWLCLQPEATRARSRGSPAHGRPSKAPGWTLLWRRTRRTRRWRTSPSTARCMRCAPHGTRTAADPAGRAA